MLIFFPHIRPWAVLCGFMFHLTIRYFMHIGFLELLICYVVFVDWHALYGRLRGKRAGVEGGVAYRSDGFKRAVVPSASTRRTKQAESADIETLAVATLKEAWSRLGG